MMSCFVYPIRGYHTLRKNCNPIRCLQLLLCVVCLLLAAYLMSKLTAIVTILIVIVLLAPITMIFVISVDVHSMKYEKPIFWNSWLMLAIGGALMFFFGAGILLFLALYVPTAGLTIFCTVATVAYIVTGIALLIDALAIIRLLCQRTQVAPRDEQVVARQERGVEAARPASLVRRIDEEDDRSIQVPCDEHYQPCRPTVIRNPCYCRVKRADAGVTCTKPVTSYGGTFHVSKDAPPLPSPQPSPQMQSRSAQGALQSRTVAVTTRTVPKIYCGVRPQSSPAFATAPSEVSRDTIGRRSASHNTPVCGGACLPSEAIGDNASVRSHAQSQAEVASIRSGLQSQKSQQADLASVRSGVQSQRSQQQQADAMSMRSCLQSQKSQQADLASVRSGVQSQRSQQQQADAMSMRSCLQSQKSQQADIASVKSCFQSQKSQQAELASMRSGLQSQGLQQQQQAGICGAPCCPAQQRTQPETIYHQYVQNPCTCGKLHYQSYSSVQGNVVSASGERPELLQVQYQECKHPRRCTIKECPCYKQYHDPDNASISPRRNGLDEEEVASTSPRRSLLQPIVEEREIDAVSNRRVSLASSVRDDALLQSDIDEYLERQSMKSEVSFRDESFQSPPVKYASQTSDSASFRRKSGDASEGSRADCMSMRSQSPRSQASVYTRQASGRSEAPSCSRSVRSAGRASVKSATAKSGTSCKKDSDDDEVQTSETRMIRARDLESYAIPGSADRSP